MGYYPIFVELKSRPCLVIGGGHEAQKKVEGLLAADAAVTVVHPDVTPDVREMARTERVHWLERSYERGDMTGFDIVMVADDDRARNGEIHAEGQERGIFVNCADDTPNCDFILPAVLRKGQVTIAASTGGASPALARRIREELTDYFSDDIPALADMLGEIRTEMRSRGIPLDAEAWQRGIDGPLRALLVQRRYDEARARFIAALGVPELFAAEATA